MRKCLLLYGVMLLYSTVVTGQATEMPDFEVVVKQFFTDYHPGIFTRFEKRPEGYYVVELEDGIRIKHRMPYYLLEEAQYRSLDGMRDRDQYVRPLQRMVDEYFSTIGSFEVRQFSLQPYYGYDGWYNDVIEWGKKKTVLTDDELYALGRAYSKAATVLIAPWMDNYSVEGASLKLAVEPPYLDQGQVANYLAIAEEALAMFEALTVRNPDYSTAVGRISTKLANERMHIYLTLLRLSDEATAAQVLVPDLYEDYFMVQSRNYLRSCPPNSVLVTYGDSDTYPLLYLQATEGFRTDVTIANLSLLQLERYRALLMAGVFGALPLTSVVPQLEEANGAIVYWLQANNRTTTITAEQFLIQLEAERLLQQNNQYSLPSTFAAGYVQIPPPRLPGAQSFGGPAVPIRWDLFNGKNFVTQQGLFLLNVILAHEGERPLCYLPTVSVRDLSPLVHLAQYGWVHRVYYHDFSEVNTSHVRAADTAFTLSFWEQQVEFDTSTIITDYDKGPYYSAQLNMGLVFAQHLYNNGQEDRAKVFLAQLLVWYPNNIYPWDDLWVPILRQVRQWQMTATEKVLVDQIRYNLKNVPMNRMSEEDRWRLAQEL